MESSLWIPLIVAASSLPAFLAARAFARDRARLATLMRLVDLVLTMPTLAVAAFLGANVRAGGVSWLTLSLVLGALMWTPLARLVRGVVLGLRELPFIDAARVMGASHGRTLLRHLVPNVTDHVIIAATLTFGAAILVAALLVVNVS